MRIHVVHTRSGQIVSVNATAEARTAILPGDDHIVSVIESEDVREEERHAHLRELIEKNRIVVDGERAFIRPE